MNRQTKSKLRVKRDGDVLVALVGIVSTALAVTAITIYALHRGKDVGAAVHAGNQKIEFRAQDSSRE